MFNYYNNNNNNTPNVFEVFLQLTRYINYLLSYCLSNALRSSIGQGQNIKSLACPVSDVRSLISGQSVKKFKWP